MVPDRQNFLFVNATKDLLAQGNLLAVYGEADAAKFPFMEGNNDAKGVVVVVSNDANSSDVEDWYKEFAKNEVSAMEAADLLNE